MTPWEIVDRARAPDGAELVLARRGGEWAIRAAGRVLMSSRAHASEEALAALALRRARRREAILIGGLGMGFTLRAALDRLPASARAIVVELVPAVVEWNRGPLAPLAGRPLDDPRVRLVIDDVGRRVAEARGAYDAILLDVDNGPEAVVRPANAGLYGDRGAAAGCAALRDGGVLALWSAGADPLFRARLERAGMETEEAWATEGPGGGRRRAILLARRAARGGRARRVP